MAPKRVAVVGAGCAGLATILALRGSEHEVHLFDARDDPLGGLHDIAVVVDGGVGCRVNRSLAIYDANFGVMARAYSLFPDAVPFNFTSSSSRQGYRHLWYHSFGQRLEGSFKNWLPRPVLNISSWALPVEIARFNLVAIDDLRRESSRLRQNGQDLFTRPIATDDESICQYLRRNRYSAEFRERYLFPLICILYTVTDRGCLLDLPMIHVLRRLFMLNLLRSPSSWANWSAAHRAGPQFPIDAIEVPFRSNYRVTSLRRHEKTGLFAIIGESGDDISEPSTDAEPCYEWDHVVLAVPADVAREIMSEIATKEEHGVLSEFSSDLIVAVLERHHAQRAATDGLPSTTFNYNCSPDLPDPSVMLSYGYRQTGVKAGNPSSPSREHAPIVASVALNLRSPPYDLSVIQTLWEYQQPRLTRRSLLAQTALEKIQNTRGISYAGAWTETGNVGWHEDAARSGFRVAEEHLGAKHWKKGVDFDAIRGREEAIASARTLPTENGSDKLVMLGMMLILTALQVLDFMMVLLAVICGYGEGRWESTEERPLSVYSDEEDDACNGIDSRTGRLKSRLAGKRSSHPSLSRKLY